jgi:hypothetical protein
MGHPVILVLHHRYLRLVKQIPQSRGPKGIPELELGNEKEQATGGGGEHPTSNIQHPTSNAGRCDAGGLGEGEKLDGEGVETRV